MSSDVHWPKLPREELVALVRRIMNADGTEDEIDMLADLFESSVLMPNATALIFWPGNHAPRGIAPYDYHPTPEEVVDRVLAYQSIILGSGGDVS